MQGVGDSPGGTLPAEDRRLPVAVDGGASVSRGSTAAELGGAVAVANGAAPGLACGELGAAAARAAQRIEGASASPGATGWTLAAVDGAPEVSDTAAQNGAMEWLLRFILVPDSRDTTILGAVVAVRAAHCATLAAAVAKCPVADVITTIKTVMSSQQNTLKALAEAFPSVDKFIFKRPDQVRVVELPWVCGVR